MKLIPKGKKVFVELDNGSVVPLRDMTPEDVDPLIIIVGPFGPVAKFLGFHENTHVLYFLKDSADKQAIIDIIQGGGVMAVFQNRRGIGMPGTLDAFWRRKDAKPLTKLLAGALQFIDDDKLYLTHMSVRSKWRRNRLNWLMVEEVRESYPSLELVFDDPTDMGRKFMRKYQP